jgi:hypothetical protein
VRTRCFGSIVIVATALFGVLLPRAAGAQAAATPPAVTPPGWAPTRTADGQPDMQGLWNQQNNITTYSMQAGRDDRAEHISMSGQAPATGRPIKDPPDEKIPYQPWAADLANFLHEQHRSPSKPEYLDPVTRGFMEGVPRINLQGGFQIVQPPGYVVILHEYGHHYRIIPLDGRPHLGGNIKLWMGDSRGRWEGNTLVVDVTNHNDQTWFDIVGSFHTDALQLQERWTFVGPDRIDYEVTLADPKAYTRPWKMGWNYARNKEPGYEQWENAVWEGNKATDVIIGDRDRLQGSRSEPQSSR